MTRELGFFVTAERVLTQLVRTTCVTLRGIALLRELARLRFRRGEHQLHELRRV